MAFARSSRCRLSFLLGTITAVRRGPFDRILLLIAVVLSALPDFVIAITLVILFATVVFRSSRRWPSCRPGTSPLDHPNS